MDEILGILQAGDSACRLDLYMGADMLGKESHIFTGSAASAKAGGGFDVVGTGSGNDLAELDFLLLGEEAAFDDDLQQLAAAGQLHLFDLLQNILPQLVLHPAEVDHHINFLRAVFNGIGGFEAFDRSGAVAIGEADNGTNGQCAAKTGDSRNYMAGRHADGGRAVFHRLMAKVYYISTCGALLEQRMVNCFHDILNFHNSSEYMYKISPGGNNILTINL